MIRSGGILRRIPALPGYQVAPDGCVLGVRGYFLKHDGKQIKIRTQCFYIEDLIENAWLGRALFARDGDAVHSFVRQRRLPRKRQTKHVIRLDSGREYDSAIIAGKELGITPENIRSCCRGRSKTAGGVAWTYD